MNKYLKYGLLALGSVTLATAGGAAYLVASFDPNDYKDRIIRLVKERTQRNLRLDGDIKLAFFPGIGADVSRAALSGVNSTDEFATLDAAHVSLALLPLFSGQLVVDEVKISGLKVMLVKSSDGRTNIDDLLGMGKGGNAASASGGTGPLQLDIAAVRMEKSELNYRDEGTGRQYSLMDINLDTGRIGGGVPTRVGVNAKLRSALPELDLATELQAVLSIDLERSSYRLSGVDLQANGSMSGASRLALRAFMPEMAGDTESFKSDALSLDIGIEQPENSFRVRLDSPVNGDFKLQQFTLPDLVVAVEVGGDTLPNQRISSELKGSINLDGAQRKVQLDLAGGLLQSQVKAKVAVDGFIDPAIRFDIDVDQFDADPFLAGKSDRAAAARPLDLAALRKLDLAGRLHIGKLKVANITSSQLRLELTARNGIPDPEAQSGKLRAHDPQHASSPWILAGWPGRQHNAGSNQDGDGMIGKHKFQFRGGLQGSFR